MKHSPKILNPKDGTDFLSRHHCYPKGRMKHERANIKHLHLTIKLWRKKHDYWHLLFKFATIDEITFRLSWDNSVYYNPYYSKIFKCDRIRACQILQRTKQIKTRDYAN